MNFSFDWAVKEHYDIFATCPTYSFGATSLEKFKTIRYELANLNGVDNKAKGGRQGEFWLHVVFTIIPCCNNVLFPINQDRPTLLIRLSNVTKQSCSNLLSQ